MFFFIVKSFASVPYFPKLAVSMEGIDSLRDLLQTGSSGRFLRRR